MPSILCPSGHRHLLPVLEGSCWLDDDDVREVGITRREHDVVSLLLRYGWSNQEIADKLFLTEDTIKTHFKRLMARAGIHTRTELIVAVFRGRIRLVPAAVEGGHARGVMWSASKEPISL